GWKDRRLVEFFVNYSKVLFNRFKNKVKHWMTFNEINAVICHPFRPAGLRIKEYENEEQVMYQAIIRQLATSTKVVILCN
ncbi:family 1 glycosylhydrolase, partial [Pantoea sp. SIMBA_079]|uniref:family 1 glycosylhydrolase n=1 Tax=Pantoea sp. SIMBA_079 TaxID=3085817 RepID=UPI00399324D3